MTDQLATVDRPTSPALPGLLRLGTRRSLLARTQSLSVAKELQSVTGCQVDLVEITTAGDTSTEELSSIGGTGVFATALRQALLSGEIDLAVHSLKDLPTAAYPGLALAAVVRRSDPRDALISDSGLTLRELPAGARIGTGSPRRAAQLRALGLDFVPIAIRGNVDTRISFVRDGSVDAVILAQAGLLRLGRADEASEVLDCLTMLPAPGQGALAVECRSDDLQLRRALHEHLDDPETRAAVTAERAVLAGVEAGCLAPLGALAEVVESLDAAGCSIMELSLRAVVLAPDGARQLRRSIVGPVTDPIRLGQELARGLLAEGAADLLVGARSGSARGHPQATKVAPPDLSANQSAPERAS